MRVIVAPRAGADLERLREFLAEHNPAAAERASRAILDRLRLLSQLPALGKPLGRSDLRELYVPFVKSAYVIRYCRSIKTQCVDHIAHLACARAEAIARAHIDDEALPA